MASDPTRPANEAPRRPTPPDLELDEPGKDGFDEATPKEAIFGPELAKALFGPDTVKPLFGPDSAKTVFGPDLAKTIFGPALAFQGPDEPFFGPDSATSGTGGTPPPEDPKE